jgi:hypothetical protein
MPFEVHKCALWTKCLPFNRYDVYLFILTSSSEPTSSCFLWKRFISTKCRHFTFKQRQDDYCSDQPAGWTTKESCFDFLYLHIAKTGSWAHPTPTESVTGFLPPEEENFFGENLSQTPWSEFASELYRPSYRRLSMKLVPTFGDRWCRAWSAWRIPTAVFSAF